MTKKPQIEKFREKARELGDEIDPEKFDAALRKVASHQATPKDLNDLAEMIGQTEPDPSKRDDR